MGTDDRLNKLKGNPVLFEDPAQDPDAPGPRVLNVDDLEHVKELCKTFGVYFKQQNALEQERASDRIGVSLGTLRDWATQAKLPAPNRCPALVEVIYNWQEHPQASPHNLPIKLVGDTLRKKRRGEEKPRHTEPLPPLPEALPNRTPLQNLQDLKVKLSKKLYINSLTDEQAKEFAVNFILACWKD